MKIDSEFIKEILLTIEEDDDYIISSHELMKKLEVETKEDERKFMGHILILADKGILESFSPKYPFGFVYGVEGEYSILDVGYRLTAHGYEIIEKYKKKSHKK